MNLAHAMMHGFGMDWAWPIGWLGGILALLVPILFWVIIVLVAVKLVKSRPTPAAASSGLQVLEERYARGEITRDEFLERRAVLSGNSPSA